MSSNDSGTDPFPVHDFDPRNVPPDILQGVGLILLQSNFLENTIQDAIAGMLGVDVEYGKAVTAHMPMPLRYSVLLSAAEIRIDDLSALDTLDTLVEQAKTAFNRRNAFAHREWFIHADGSGTYTIRESARTRLEVDIEKVTVTDLQDTANEIRRAGLDLFSFLHTRGLTPTIPDQPRPRGHKSKTARKKRRNL